jgi:hypothetical protein
MLVRRAEPLKERLSRRGFQMNTSAVPYVKRVVSDAQAAKTSVVVLPRFSDGCMEKDPFALFCRAAGGYLTCSPWVQIAVVDRVAPKMLFYPGVAHKKITLWIADELAADEGSAMAVAALRVFSKSPASAISAVKQKRFLLCKCDAYVEERGPRSKPASCHAALVLTASDRERVAEEDFPRHAAVVQTLAAFLDRLSAPVPTAAAVGCW